MRDNDPRHGTYAGYNQGCRDDCCKTAARNYQKRRVYEAAHGRPRTIDGTGTRRRLEALVALGWCYEQIGERLGVTGTSVYYWGRRGKVYRTTAETVARLYESMSNERPPQNTPGQKMIVTRMLKKAADGRYALPIHWDDIDNDPEPWFEGSSRRPGKPGVDIAEFDFLVSCGESEEQAARRLGVTLGAIETARLRARKVA